MRTTLAALWSLQAKLLGCRQLLLWMCLTMYTSKVSSQPSTHLLNRHHTSRQQQHTHLTATSAAMYDVANLRFYVLLLIADWSWPL
jgi:hypothetical protein